jgi:arylsulfatase A-like enzyme
MIKLNRLKWRCHILIVISAFLQFEQACRAADKPNIVYFLADNLGYGELGCYGGGKLRGADTVRLDDFASRGLRLMNFAPESQYTPSRSALMTGR